MAGAGGAARPTVGVSNCDFPEMLWDLLANEADVMLKNLLHGCRVRWNFVR